MFGMHRLLCAGRGWSRQKKIASRRNPPSRPKVVGRWSMSWGQCTRTLGPPGRRLNLTGGETAAFRPLRIPRLPFLRSAQSLRGVFPTCPYGAASTQPKMKLLLLHLCFFSAPVRGTSFPVIAWLSHSSGLSRPTYRPVRVIFPPRITHSGYGRPDTLLSPTYIVCPMIIFLSTNAVRDIQDNG
jgi:hypothetical protein